MEIALEIINQKPAKPEQPNRKDKKTEDTPDSSDSFDQLYSISIQELVKSKPDEENIIYNNILPVEEEIIENIMAGLNSSEEISPDILLNRKTDTVDNLIQPGLEKLLLNKDENPGLVNLVGENGRLDLKKLAALINQNTTDTLNIPDLEAALSKDNVLLFKPLNNNTYKSPPDLKFTDEKIINTDASLGPVLSETSGLDTDTAGNAYESALNKIKGSVKEGKENSPSKDTGNSNISVDVKIHDNNKKVIQLTHTKLKTAITEKDIVDQVVTGIKKGISNNKSEIKLNLNPPSLGNIKIKIVSSNEMISAKISADNLKVKHLIENNAAFLKEAMEVKGIKIQDIVFSTHNMTGYNEGNFKRHQEERNWTKKRKTEMIGRISLKENGELNNIKDKRPLGSILNSNVDIII